LNKSQPNQLKFQWASLLAIFQCGDFSQKKSKDALANHVAMASLAEVCNGKKWYGKGHPSFPAGWC
jgi:hypothetical protein